MSNVQRAPVDELSGIPLPMYYGPVDNPPIYEGSRNTHHYFYPKESLKADSGARAVRHVLIHSVPFAMHVQFHKEFGEGPRLPVSDLQKYGTVVLAAAGYLPPEAITFDTKGNHRRVALTDDERRRLWESRTIHSERMAKIQEFLFEYTVSHGFPFMSGRLIDEFLHTKDEERRLNLGRELLLLACEATTDPLRDLYNEARRSRLLPRARSRQVGHFVCNLLTLRHGGFIRKGVVTELEPLLAA